jgi:hypothetical protein
MPPQSSENFTLIRYLNIHFTPNKVLLIIVGLVFLASFGWSMYMGLTLTKSIVSAIIQLLIVFFCWAIGRELDPDNNYAAFLGIPFLFLPLTFNQGNIFVLLWFLIGIRLINQTTGKKTSSTDVTFFVFISLLSAAISYQLILLPLSIVIIFFSSFLPKKHPELSLLSIPLFPSFLLLVLVYPNAWVFLNASPWILVYIALSSGLLFLVTTTTDKIESTGDHSFRSLSLKRVQSAQLLTVISVLLISMFHGNILSVFPVWSSITGIGLFRLGQLFIKK